MERGTGESKHEKNSNEGKRKGQRSFVKRESTEEGMQQPRDTLFYWCTVPFLALVRRKRFLL